MPSTPPTSPAPAPVAARTLAVLGVGRMGAPVARRLAAAGHHVRAWSRNPAQAAALAPAGVEQAPSPADAVRGVDALVLLLANDAAIEELLDAGGVAAALAPPAVVIEMSTCPPAGARRRAAALAERGIGHIDAPVSGGVTGAEAGTLSIMVGGDADVLARVADVLAPLGRTTHVGPSGAGQLAKAVNQTIVSGAIAAVAEGIALARAGGADAARVHEALRGGWADGPVFRELGARMIERDFTPGASVASQIKDLRIILELAASLGLELPLTREIAARYEALRDAGEDQLDHSALIRLLEPADRPSPPATGAEG